MRRARRLPRIQVMKMPRPMMYVLVILSLLPIPAASGQNKPSGQASSVKLVVLKDDNGKPVRNAAVILHPVKQSGKQARAESN